MRIRDTLSLGSSRIYRAVGGPYHGSPLWIADALLNGQPIHLPHYIKGDDGKTQVIGIVGYSPEPDTGRAIFQVEARAQ